MFKSCLYIVWLVFSTITFGNAVNSEHFPLERILSFVEMRYSDSARIRSLSRRTFRFYDPDYVAMDKLESIIYDLESINDTVNYDDIWSLSKQMQLSSISDISKRVLKLCQFICKYILKEQRAFLENPKARKLMHALGFQSITIHEYDALNLKDDEQIQKLNISESGIKKLKLLLLASRGSENHLTAVLNDSDVFQQSAHLQQRAYNEISSTHKLRAVPLWIWSNFPWLAAPAGTYFPAYTSMLYFGALHEFLWRRYYHEFGFPKYDSTYFISNLDDEDLIEKIEFVKYMMDRYRLRIHESFSESKRETLQWMEEYVLRIGPDDIALDVGTSWMSVKQAQRCLYWTLTEAVRLNELLMPDEEVLTNQFMTEYVLAITEGIILKITSRKQIPFVRKIIMDLIDFNGPEEIEKTLRLKEILKLVDLC